MKSSDLKKKALYFLDILINSYPDARIELNYNKKDAWELLVVVALSAQTTDRSVNLVSPALFKKFKNIQAFAKATPEQIEPYIKSLGLYRNKAKNLVLAAQKIINDFDSQIPQNRDLLETIPGVGKKTAAVIIANAFNIQAIAVDTHVARVAYRLGLTKSRAPAKIESELSELFPKNMLTKAHITLIFHGRRVCIARKPHCSICPVQEACPRVGVTVWQ